MPANPMTESRLVDHPIDFGHTARGLRGSVALAGLLVLHDAIVDGSWLLAGLVCPLWLVVAFVRRMRSPAAPWGLARVLIPIVTGLVIVGNSALQRRVATTNAARLVEACERHREALGEYPARLADLVPRFMPAIPRAKYCLMRGEYRYTAPPTATLSWFDVPPFGRRVYRFDTGEWRSVD